MLIALSPPFFYALFILLLCVHKEVARNAPALHAGPHAFFYEKSLAKKLFICLGSSFFPLLLLLVRSSRLCCSLFWCRCIDRELMAKEIAQLANPKRTLRILANEWLVQRITYCAFLSWFVVQGYAVRCSGTVASTGNCCIGKLRN